MWLSFISKYIEINAEFWWEITQLVQSWILLMETNVISFEESNFTIDIGVKPEFKNISICLKGSYFIWGAQT